MTGTLAYYEKNASELSLRYESADLKALHADLVKHLPGGRVLDVGCGSGRDAAALTAAGLEVFGVDGSANLLEEAARLHPELAARLFNCCLPSALPFDDRYFAGFYSIACLMHFNRHEIALILSELKRVLRPDGLGFVSVPVCRADVDNNGLDEHGRVFTLLPVEEWQKLFAECGFVAEVGSENADSLGREGISWISFLLFL